jgi:hypothetical protein
VVSGLGVGGKIVVVCGEKYSVLFSFNFNFLLVDKREMGYANKKLKQIFLVPLPGVNTTKSSNERLRPMGSFEGIVW